jgi:hypothetical protein
MNRKIDTKKIALLLFLTLGFNACTGMQVQKEESAFIIMKTATFKYADMGFISNSSSTVKVEIYGAGQPLMNLEINAMNVCMSTFKCMEKKDFNEKVLHTSYPDTLLENIFRAKPIFSEKNLEKKENGFSQKITKDGIHNISYTVKGGERIFRDKINKILIKVREQ